MPEIVLWTDELWFMRGRRIIVATDIPGTSQYEGDED